MDEIGSNIAVGSAMLIALTLLLRRVPVLRLVLRVMTSLLLLFSPIGLVVLLTAFVWFHGGSWLIADEPRSTVDEDGHRIILRAPLPPERPR